MDVSQQNNSNANSRILFAPSTLSAETAASNKAINTQSAVLVSWLIQLARYWSLDQIEVCAKPKANLDKRRFTTLDVAQQSCEQLAAQLESGLSNQSANPSLNDSALTDLHHFCFICPVDAIISDTHLIQTWQHPDCEFQLLICGDTNLLPKLSQQRFQAHFDQVFSQVKSSPEYLLNQVECVPKEEYHTIVSLWNDTDRDYPIDQRVDQLFSIQANKTPNNVALRFKQQSIDYSALTIKVNQFAQFLVEQGVSEGKVVGLCLTRTPLWPIGMLAIWRVGATFLPLEAELPDERLSYILQDSDCQLVVTEDDLASRFNSEKTQVASISLAALEKHKEYLDCASNHVDTLAYIIYTSGTTGLPKGVKVNHRGLSNLAYCQYERMSFAPNQRILQAVSFNFDASLHDVTFALLSGSTLCIADENERLPGPAMVEFLRDENINFITLPPSALETLPFEDLPELHTILAVGEVCSSNLVNRWAGIKKFFNGYGPTETTVGALIGECFSNEQKPTIGTALANVRIYILDHRMKPVPIGVIGEIYVGGVGVAQGYMNKPERTAQTFVANPFSSDTHSKLYKTGDKARFLADGRVDFIGRIDDQVKIAGRRIEIEEIEARCKSFEQINNAAVIVHRDEAGNKLLRAFVLLDDAKTAHQKVKSLKQYLIKYLPSYMLPVQYFVLKEFPASINGKLDRKRLERIENDAKPTTNAIKESLSLQNIQIVFKGVGQNIYLPICYYGNPDNAISKQQIADKLDQELASFLQPFTLFSLGNLPNIDSAKAIEQLPTPTDYEDRWQTLKSRPSTESQKILEAIWLKELNSNEVFLDDNFVDCGGDSLKAVKIILELKTKTGVELTGADLFGSDFGYCAARLESEITGKPLELSLAPETEIPETVKAFYFTSGEHQLYGVYHPPTIKQQSQKAVLICSGLTNDYQRARPMLQKLAARLCASGIPVLRFDYYGCGDSEGNSDEMTLSTLNTNISSSVEQLKQLSECSEIVIFAVRLGANLVSNTEFSDEVKQLIYLDPPATGKEFLDKQRKIHHAILNDTNYFQWRKQDRKFESYQEILGQYFSHEFVAELESLELNLSRHKDRKIDLILSKGSSPSWPALSKTNNQPIREFSLSDDYGWQATDKIDTTIIAKNLFQQLVTCVRGD